MMRFDAAKARKQRRVPIHIDYAPAAHLDFSWNLMLVGIGFSRGGEQQKAKN